MAKKYNLYISHSWRRHNQLIRLRGLLDRRSYFSAEFLEASPDRPINSQNESYIKQRLVQKIRTSDVLLVMAGVYATTSDWITFELKVAYDLGIPIIGVVPWGQINISNTVRTYAVEIVGWNTESIVQAIRNHL